MVKTTELSPPETARMKKALAGEGWDSTRVPSLDYLSETCWIHKISYKFPNYGIQKTTTFCSQTILEFIGNFMSSNWKTWGKPILGNILIQELFENYKFFFGFHNWEICRRFLLCITQTSFWQVVQTGNSGTICGACDSWAVGSMAYT